jgi:hypothetical protein
MELIVRGSEYQDFLNCRKKWYYSWVEKITPKRPDNKLFIGTAFHKWLENYYNNECSKLSADMLTSVWMNEQDTSGMEQTELDDMIKLLKGLAENYDNEYQHNDSLWKILATELEFLIKLDEGIYMTGTIDLVYEVGGKIRFADHKTVASLSMYEEKSKMDRQISRYWWALKQIAAGIGKVKDRNPAVNRWISFPELEGKEIEGFDYNLIAKDVPKEPKVLKSGKLSTDKSQKTTYDKYLAKIHELNQDPIEYYDMLNMLKDKPDPFLKRVNVLRGDAELESAAWEFMYTANDIHDIRTVLRELPHRTETVTYRNIGTQCDMMCQFKALCQTTIEGGNVSLTKNLAYQKKEEKK